MSFIEVYFNSVLRATVAMESGVTSIGRAPDNTICLDNKGVSSHHALITKKEGQFFIEDINSTNGTFLNEKKITTKQPLSFDDSIGICKHTLKFVQSHSESVKVQQTGNTYIEDDSDSTIMISSQRIKTKPIDPEQSTKNSYLLVHGEERGVQKLLLNKPHYSIGKAKCNDLRVGGWFTPKEVAEINRVGDSYYLTVLKGKVLVNKHRVDARIRLTNDDDIKFKKLTLKFLNE